jgi:hypothetical protein
MLKGGCRAVDRTEFPVAEQQDNRDALRIESSHVGQAVPDGAPLGAVSALAFELEPGRANEPDVS